MNIEVSYDKEFAELLDNLRSKYGAEIFEIEGIGSQLDLNKFSREFFSTKTTADASIDDNSNVGDSSLISYTIELTKPYEKLNSLYLIWKEMRRLYHTDIANKIIEMGISGDLYIHDSHSVNRFYCYNYSTYDIMTKGLPMVSKIKSLPPKYLYSFKSQLEQFIVIASNSSNGASGVADTLLVMSYYVKNIIATLSDGHFKFASEDDVWAYIKETLVSLIYTVNQPFRAGHQSPFVNISIFDKYFIEDLSTMYIFDDGSTLDINIVNKIQDIYLNIMNEEMRRTPVTFPVTTACFSIDENNEFRDVEFVKYIIEKNKEFGFINLYSGKSTTLSSCCRLRSDMSSIGYANSIGGSSTKIGSVGVTTINMYRLAKRSSNIDEFKQSLQEMVGACARINHARRTIIRKKIERGFAPLYTHEFVSLDKQFSTCGINGFYEAMCELGIDITSDAGLYDAINIIDTINAENHKYDKSCGYPHNCEQTPSESASVKMAKKDRILSYNTEYELYSNQFIPLTVSADILERIKIQGALDSHFSGGSILHLNFDKRIDDADKIYDILQDAVRQGVIYMAINYVLNECENGHMSVGNVEMCPVCAGKLSNKYSRIVGYLSNVKNWNKVRRTVDFPNRKFYNSKMIE